MEYVANQSDDHEEENITLGPAYSSNGRMSAHTRPLYSHYDGGYGRAEINDTYPAANYAYNQQRYLRQNLPEQWPDQHQYTVTARHYHGLAPDLAPWNRPVMQGDETTLGQDSEPFGASPGTYSHHTHAIASSGASADDETETPSVASEEPDNGANMPGSRSKKFRCPTSDCSAAFSRKADKDRHFECVHRRGANKKHDCPVVKCTRNGDLGFTRKDHLTEHLRNYHHQQIPKRKKARSDGAAD